MKERVHEGLRERVTDVLRERMRTELGEEVASAVRTFSQEQMPSMHMSGGTTNNGHTMRD